MYFDQLWQYCSVMLAPFVYSYPQLIGTSIANWLARKLFWIVIQLCKMCLKTYHNITPETSNAEASYHLSIYNYLLSFNDSEKLIKGFFVKSVEVRICQSFSQCTHRRQNNLYKTRYASLRSLGTWFKMKAYTHALYSYLCWHTHITQKQYVHNIYVCTHTYIGMYARHAG